MMKIFLLGLKKCVKESNFTNQARIQAGALPARPPPPKKKEKRKRERESEEERKQGGNDTFNKRKNVC